MAETTTISVPVDVRDRLRALASEVGRTLVEEITVLIDDAEERRWRAAAYEEYAQLAQDPEAWQDYRAELTEWDQLGARDLRARGAA